MNFRNEQKIEISPFDLYVLRNRLKAVLKPDKHSLGGKYFVRSLYFDTPEDTALYEKINGVGKREKFRIRYYNFDTGLIHLEKKSKINGLCCKQSDTLTSDEVKKIISGDIKWMSDDDRAVVREMYINMKCRRLMPKTVVDYTREPFVFDAGNVRITFDYNIRTSYDCENFLSADLLTLPTENSPILMEVKWDEFLPDVIRDVISLNSRHSAAFSKYAQCRMYN